MPPSRDWRLGKKAEAEAEAGLEESEIEVGNVGGSAAGFVGRVAARVADNSQLAEGIVVVGGGTQYTRVGQLVGAVDVVVEGAAGTGFVARVLLTWADIQPG